MMPRSAKRGRNLQNENNVEIWLDRVRQLLKEKLNMLWQAQSEVTQLRAVREIRSGIQELYKECASGRRHYSELLFKQMFSSMSVILFTDAALKIPSNKENERKQYIDTMKMMAELLYDMYASQESEETFGFERFVVVHIIRCFAKGLSAGRWEVRHRIMQFINFFLEKCEAGDEVFDSCVNENDPEENDLVKQQILLRAYDLNFKVAALAMEAIGHYQEDESGPKKSKAFTVLLFRMQEHESALVRGAATKAIAVCALSAPAILRRVVDKSPEVRVVAYEILGESISPKIVNAQLRSYIFLTGLNDENASVKSAALCCLGKWLKDTGATSDEMISDKGVGPDHRTLYARKQLTIEVFNCTESVYGTVKQNVESRTRSKNVPSVASGSAQDTSVATFSDRSFSLADQTERRVPAD